MRYRPAFARVTLVALAVALAACGVATRTPSLHEQPPADPVWGRPDTLKAHLRSGELLMLTWWKVDTATRRLVGTGMLHSVLRTDRVAVDTSIALDSVALFETNDHGAAYPLGLQGVAASAMVGAAVSLACLADPKSCFGSCPTFYMEGDEDHIVHAEGFSSSIASVLEARDVDAMPRARASGRRVVLHMKNEAWETHVVRHVNLLAAPRPAGGYVFTVGDSLFLPALRVSPPTACAGPEGDCQRELAHLDGVERRSAADAHDLATRETIELTFADVPAAAGLALTTRNSLITTFLFYQSMAYAGTNMAALVAAMERGGRDYAKSFFGMERLLGGIDAEAFVDGAWVPIGTFGEAGPIASDTKLLPLPAAVMPRAGEPLHVRLRMARGHWRIDRAALAALGDPVGATRVRPSRVERNGVRDDAALATLLDSAATLVSMPGDDFRLTFELPGDAEGLELFLESQGYYYEWQRRAWTAEEDPVMAAMVVNAPALALKKLAPRYKRGEAEMERLFWRSRFNASTGGRRVVAP